MNVRLLHLSANPLCILCNEHGRVTAATVVDHIRPHKGDEQLFFNPDNLQSLCAPCHDGPVQQMEQGTYQPHVGIDGWPIEHSTAIKEMIERKG